MSAFEDVRVALGTALAKLAEATGHLNAARVAWNESSDSLRVLQGTSDAEAQEGLTAHYIGRDQLVQVQELLDRSAELIKRYGSSIGANPDSTPDMTAPARVLSEPADCARSAPPRPPRPGKTHGRWFDSDGNAVVLESGKGGKYYDSARQRSVDLGLTHGIPNAEASIARHVEVQFAMRMMDQGILEAEIEINRPVCGTRPGIDDDLRDTCDKQLPRFLPPGSTLRVKDGSSFSGRLYKGEEEDR